MNPKEQKQLIKKPEVSRLKMLGSGLKVGRVLGRRVLVKDVEPETEMDEVEKRGLLVIPESVKEANTPKSSVGIVLQLGDNFDYPGLDNFVPYSVSEGDMVLFSKYAGVQFAVDKELGYRIVDESEIICTFERADKGGESPAQLAMVKE